MYGPWFVMDRIKPGIYRAMCSGCSRIEECTSHMLAVARRRDYAGCAGCRRDRAAARRWLDEIEKRAVRFQGKPVWTGSELVSQAEAARRLGLTRERIRQLVAKSPDLSERFSG